MTVPGALGRGRPPPQGLRAESACPVPGLTLRSPWAPTDPAFVASAHIPESLGSSQGDDDKIYFFFSETGQEFEFFENTIVSRIARICKVRGRVTQRPPRAPQVLDQEMPGGPPLPPAPWPFPVLQGISLANGFSFSLLKLK